MFPDLIDYVVGFRQWALGRIVDMHMEEGLWAISQPIQWSRTMTARCLKRDTSDSFVPSPHEAPNNDCECGLYAKHDMGYPLGLQSGCGYGAIKAWGKMQVHHDGFRAAHAEVIALAHGGYWSEAGLGLVHRVADDVGIAVVPLEELAELAFEHGTPVPKELRPEWPRTMNWTEAA